MKSIKITANASFLFGNVQSNSGHWECQNFCVSFLQIRRGVRTFSYDQGQLSRITTPLGNHLDIVCRDGKILQITDEIGRRLQYRYEGDFLTEVVHTDEGITHYEYDSQGHVLSATNENGTRYVENEYDGKGRVVRQTLPDGTTQRFEYDDRKRRNTILFGDSGRKEVYEYNDQLLVTRIIYGDGTSVSYEYSDQNHRIGETSRNGYRTSRVYDNYGRLIGEAKPDGYESHQEYDESHDLVRVWDTDGRETVNTYDNSHNLLISREKIGENRWKETRYQYDEKGRCVLTRDALGNETVKQFAPNQAYPSLVTTPEGEETAYEYDQVGRRMAVSNTYGNVHLSYNSRNFVTKRTDGEGNVSRWFYSRMGNLVSYYPPGSWEEKKEGYGFLYNLQERRVDTVSPMKNHHRLFRDFDGNITREIHPVSYQERGEDGEGTRYEYDWYGNQIRIFYADGGCERRFYDPDGNLIKQVMPEAYDPETDDGAGYTYTYDPMGRLSRIEDPDGNLAHSYRYNGHGQTVWEADGEGTEHFYEYNGLGLKSRERVGIRKEKDVVFYRVTAYEYDLQGNKVGEAYGQEEVAGDKDPETWHRISFAYDRDNRLVKVWDEFGAEARYAYDCLGNLTMEEQVIEEGIRRHIRYSYNKNGWRVRKEERIQGNGREVTFAVTYYGYDKAGNLTKITTPNGYEIRRAYDGDGRLTEERIIDRQNGIDRRENYTYDAAGNLLSETLEGREGEILRREYGYDLKDRKIQEKNPQGGIARYLYDRNDLLIKEISPYGYGMDGGKEPGIIYRYDSRGNQIQKTNSLGEVVKEKCYNAANQLVAEIDGMGNETEFTYLPDGQTRSVSRENGGQKRQLQNYKYNARGQIIGITDGIGETVNYDVDGWGRITRIRFSDDVSEGYEYTPSGQVSRAIDGNGNSVQYQYNSLGKVRKRTDQLGYSEEFQYDGEGNLRLYVDRNGNRVCRTYNVFGNLVYEKAENQEGKNPVITTFRYDSLGRIRQAVCDGHSYEYIYNDQGLIKEKRSSGKCLISYEYDKAGQITKMTDPAGTETAYEYDLMGRTSRIFNGQGMEVRYRYDSQDRIREITYGNHVVTQYDYDGDGNVIRLETKAGEDSLLSFRYAYDGNGNRTAKYGEQATAYGRKQKVRISYRYDIRGQLVEEKENGSPTSYTYDAAGNRTGKNTPERVTRYSYNGKNQLTEEAWDTGKNIFTYDRQGSILEMAGTEGNRHFTYNSKNQQLKVVCEDGRSQENLYDAEGLRYGVKEDGVSTRFVYHRGELLQEEREGGRNSYYLGSGIEAAQMGGELYYYHQDEQLSTALLTDHVGKVRNHYRYSAFGEMLEGSESVENRIRYTGQQYDGISDQYYLRARYYNTVVGRFLQEDVYQGDGLNLYVYCGNNPVMYYDPSGYTSTGNGYEAGEIGGENEQENSEIEGKLEYVHYQKENKETDIADLKKQVQGQVEGFNRIIKKEGMKGLKDRINNYNPDVEKAGRDYVKTLEPAPPGMAYLHEPDMRTGGDPKDVTNVGSRRNNSIIGGQANRIANDILNMSDKTTKISGILNVIEPKKK